MTPPSWADDNASSVRAAVSSGKHDTVLATSSVEMPHSGAQADPSSQSATTETPG